MDIYVVIKKVPYGEHGLTRIEQVRAYKWLSDAREAAAQIEEQANNPRAEVLIFYAQVIGEE